MTYEEAAAKFRLVPVTHWRIEYRASPDELDVFDIFDESEENAKEEMNKQIARLYEQSNMTDEEFFAKMKTRTNLII